MMEVFPLADEFQAGESFIEARQIDARNIQARFLRPAVTGPSARPASIDIYTLTQTEGNWVISAMQSTVVSRPPVNTQEPAVVSGTNRPQAAQYNELGKENMGQGYFDQALAHFNEAIGLNPHNEEYYHSAARALSLAGNPSGSNTYCDKALQINPRCSRCYLRKANNFEDVQAYDAAIDSAKMVSQNGGSIDDQVLATALIARCCNTKEQYYDTINFCNAKLESLRQTGSPHYLVMVYGSLIVAYDAVGNYYQALEEARNIDNITGHATFYEGFNMLYKAKGIAP
jgi:tetratricopeptide (TPR) repeat protein